MSKQTKEPEPLDKRWALYSQPNDKCFFCGILEILLSKTTPYKFSEINVIFVGGQAECSKLCEQLNFISHLSANQKYSIISHLQKSMD